MPEDFRDCSQDCLNSLQSYGSMVRFHNTTFFSFEKLYFLLAPEQDTIGMGSKVLSFTKDQGVHQGVSICAFVSYSGLNKFSEDIFMMLGRKPNIYFKATWVFVTPALIIVSICRHNYLALISGRLILNC